MANVKVAAAGEQLSEDSEDSFGNIVIKKRAELGDTGRGIAIRSSAANW